MTDPVDWGDLARKAIDQMPDSWQINTEDYSAINPDHMPKLASGIQLFIACIIASLIDAGSERDAVMEDEALYLAILNELKEWGPNDDTDRP